jgi:hypothetical protein
MKEGIKGRIRQAGSPGRRAAQRGSTDLGCASTGQTVAAVAACTVRTKVYLVDTADQKRNSSMAPP